LRGSALGGATFGSVGHVISPWEMKRPTEPGMPVCEPVKT
jgi:hypothetical protein